MNSTETAYAIAILSSSAYSAGEYCKPIKDIVCGKTFFVENKTFTGQKESLNYTLNDGSDLGIPSVYHGQTSTNNNSIINLNECNNYSIALNNFIFKCKNLQNKYDWETTGMIRPTDKVIDNTIDIISLCPFHNLLEKANVFLCNNGSIILKWNLGYKVASINIGTDSYSYAIVNIEQMKAENMADSTMNDKSSISNFYQLLKSR